MSSLIDSKTGRGKLKPRPSPYWVKLQPGQFLGYRRTTEAEGVWVVKHRDPETGERAFKTLGVIVGPEAYRDAKEQAEAWFKDRSAGVTHQALTVGDVCLRYVDAKRAKDGDVGADAELARLKRLVFLDPLANIELSKLRPQHFQDWRARVVATPAKVTRSKEGPQSYRKRSPATINRDLVPLRAALNAALDDGHIATDFAWRKHLKPIEGADSRRDTYLDRDQRRVLIEAAEPAIRPLLAALCLLPVRPGALAALKAGDFNRRQSALRIGQDKAGGDRAISLPAGAATFFAEQAKGKTPRAPLLARPDGTAWDKDAWKGPIKVAVRSAGLPDEVTAYTLRHSIITDLITAGEPLMTIAQISGTSVAMIEKHYAHLQSGASMAALARLAL